MAQILKHKCSDCGFLCYKIMDTRFLGMSEPASGWHIPQHESITKFEEIPPKNRPDKYEIKPSYKTPACYRHEHYFEIELDTVMRPINSEESTDTVPIDNMLREKRKCRYFIRYIPGFSPAEHLSRWESISIEQSNRIWNLLYLILGAILTLIGGFLIQILTKG